MAKLKIVDQARGETLYEDLLKGLDGKIERKIGHNTWLVLRPNGIYLKLYNSCVVEVTPDNTVCFDADGWLTTTTVSRMNSIARLVGLRVSRAGGSLSVGSHAVEEEFEVETTQLDEMLSNVAAEALESVNETFDAVLADGEEDLDGEGLYLYVYGDGRWIIESPSYLQVHKNLVSAVSVYHYSGVHALEQELQQSSW